MEGSGGGRPARDMAGVIQAGGSEGPGQEMPVELKRGKQQCPTLFPGRFDRLRGGAVCRGKEE